MKTKHTPKPWKLEPSEFKVPDYYICRSNGLGIAIVERFEGISEPERLANARLIKYAPDMLAMLKLSLGAIADDCEVTRELIKQVIAKVEGE